MTSHQRGQYCENATLTLCKCYCNASRGREPLNTCCTSETHISQQAMESEVVYVEPEGAAPDQKKPLLRSSLECGAAAKPKSRVQQDRNKATNKAWASFGLRLWALLLHQCSSKHQQFAPRSSGLAGPAAQTSVASGNFRRKWTTTLPKRLPRHNAQHQRQPQLNTIHKDPRAKGRPNPLTQRSVLLLPGVLGRAFLEHQHPGRHGLKYELNYKNSSIWRLMLLCLPCGLVLGAYPL